MKEALDMGLEAEGVVIQKKPSYELLSRLTSEEKTFLLGERDYYYRGWKGKRVELNAMATDQLISWLEGRLEELGLQTKVLPPAQVVEDELEDTIGSKLADWNTSNNRILSTATSLLFSIFIVILIG